MDPDGGVEVHQGVSGEDSRGRLVDGSKAGMDRKLCWACQETASLQCSQSGGNLRKVNHNLHNILMSDLVH